MLKWPHTVQTISKEEIMEHIKCDRWQSFRLSLKGVATNEKLEHLEWWLEAGVGERHARQVQVDNYINALKRGGQLNMQLEVVR